MSSIEAQKLLSIPDAARRLGIGRTRMYELIRTGEIPTVTIGSRERQDGSAIAGRRLVPVEALDAYADALERKYSTGA